ncbi:MAG: hypothetical protein FWG43_02195 [Clostridiales bacterium]|nr:hypothetical protein [Clostridiales bacterium]
MLLYKYNGTVSESEEVELAAGLPNPTSLPLPSDFSELCVKSIYANTTPIKPKRIPELTRIPDPTRVDHITKTYIKPLVDTDSWAACVVADGKRGGGYRQIWEDLCSLILTAVEYKKNNIQELTGKNVQFNHSVTFNIVRDNIDRLKVLYSKGKPLGIRLWLNKDMKALVNV